MRRFCRLGPDKLMPSRSAGFQPALGLSPVAGVGWKLVAHEEARFQQALKRFTCCWAPPWTGGRETDRSCVQPARVMTGTGWHALWHRDLCDAAVAGGNNSGGRCPADRPKNVRAAGVFFWPAAGIVGHPAFRRAVWWGGLPRGLFRGETGAATPSCLSLLSCRSARPTVCN